MGAKGQPKASDNCMAASEKPEEMRSREIGRTLVNKGNWNYLQGWNKDESHFPCVWLPWWPAHLGHIPFHLVTFYRQPAACILKISITSELLFLQQQSQEFPDASLLHAHLMWVCLETAGSSLCCVFKGWARPECSELHKPPCQGRLKEWQRRRNLAPEPRSLLCLDLMSGCGRTILAILCLNALISHVWITSFTSLRTETLSTTAARSLCIQPWAAASPTRKEGAEQPHHLLHGRGRLKKACPILTGKLHLPPPHIWEPQHKHWQQNRNMKEGLFREEAWSCTPYGLPKLGSYSWGCWVSQSKSTGRIYRRDWNWKTSTFQSSCPIHVFLLFKACSSSCQYRKKKRTNLLSLSKSLLLFT